MVFRNPLLTNYATNSIYHYQHNTGYVHGIVSSSVHGLVTCV